MTDSAPDTHGLQDHADPPALAASVVGAVRTKRPPLFVAQEFVSHSGLQLSWKIECDALTDADWQGLAKIASELLPAFGSVVGVPEGGLRFAAALAPYATEGPLLIADDVLTTGASMLAMYEPGALGVVAFARGPVPEWVTPLFASPAAVLGLGLQPETSEQ